MFLKDLSQRFQLWNTFRPLPFWSTEPVFEFGRQALKVQIVLGEVIDRVVALGPELDVVQIRVDRAGDVAGERPWGCGPDEEMATKWPDPWYPGLIFSAVSTIFRA